MYKGPEQSQFILTKPIYQDHFFSSVLVKLECKSDNKLLFNGEHKHECLQLCLQLIMKLISS